VPVEVGMRGVVVRIEDVVGVMSWGMVELQANNVITQPVAITILVRAKA
jgi:hypothetical protein